MITAEINGRRYNNVGRILTYKDLPPRNHTLKVYVVTRTSNGRRARLIYEGRLRTRPGNIYYVTVDDYEGLDVITDCCLGDNGPWLEPNSWYRSRYYDKQNWEDNIQFNPQEDTYYNYEKGDRNSGEVRRRGRRTNNRDDWNHYENSMSTASFNELMKNINDASFEGERMTLVEQALMSNQLSTQQLVKIMNALSFESSRLTIAKMVYPKLVDKENVFRVNQGFNFSSSKDEFNEFVRSQN